MNNKRTPKPIALHPMLNQFIPEKQPSIEDIAKQYNASKEDLEKQFGGNMMTQEQLNKLLAGKTIINSDGTTINTITVEDPPKTTE
jgi:ethanolamine utilization cobalamin adenosyltransferase